MSTGTERRDDGWSAVQAADAAINREYRPHLEHALADLIAEGGTFTSDDVADRAHTTAIAAGHPGPHSPNLIGSVLGIAARKGRIHWIGRRRSSHPTRNAANISIWKAAA